jgi:AraC family transcriptional regulator
MAPRDEHVVICTLQASSPITRTLDGRRDMRHPRPGSFSVVPAGCSARWHVHGATESLHLHIPAERLREYVEQQEDVGPSATIEPAFAVTDAWFEAFHELLRTELRNAAAGGASFGLFQAQAEQMLLRHLLRRSSDFSNAPGQVAPLRPYLLARIRDYVQGHLGADITLALLAQQVHMSPDHFLRSFSAAVGSTPYQWVVQQRMEAAAHLLASTRHPVAAIARQVGYRSASHFAVQFRHRYLVTPAQYRLACSAAGPAGTSCLPATNPLPARPHGPPRSPSR